MFSIELSTPAKEYFENLKKYLSDNFDELVTADALAKEETKLENLKLFPYMGVKATKVSKLLDGYYVLIDKHEYIFYHVNEDKKAIFIELILSTKENVVQKIKDYLG